MSEERDVEPDIEGEDEEIPAWAERVFSDVDGIIPLPLAHPKSTQERIGPKPEPPKSGILTIDKPGGMTSHDVVQAVRRAADVRRVGHAGTLDPMATGVLVVCIGSATRVIEAIQEQPKTYRARVRLGISTATYDAEGETTDTRDATGIKRRDVETALEAFKGEILQVPPMYSALKHQGKRLYELARLGIEVEREPRPVTVYSLEMVDWSAPDLTLEMKVSRGTYVRSIAHDLGEALGVGAHLIGLRREAVGAFTLDESYKIPQVVDAFSEGWWPTIVYPLDQALQDRSAMVVGSAGEEALRNGQQIDGPAPMPTTTEQVRVYTVEGGFIGLVHWDDLTLRWQPARIFPRPDKPAS